jgi:hypothetical protein
MSVFHENMLIGSSGQGAPAAAGVSRSLRFNSSDSAYLSRTPASAGNRKTWTWAGWVKKARVADEKIFAGGTSIGATTFLQIFFGSTGTLRVSSGSNDWVETTQVFRDSSAWYHFVVALDTTQGTGSNRLKLYVNGVEITTFSTDNRVANISQNTDYGININAAHHIGSFQGSSAFFSGYLADIYFIDGQALDPSSFTETDATTGQLIPKAYTGSYGTNGFHLDFADNASTTTIGYDAAGSNDWTANNLSVTAGAGNDSLVDVPTNGAQTDTGVGGEVRGNYCTLNPLDRATHGSLANGNLDLNTSGGSSPNAFGTTRATFGLSSGKWYWEVTPTSFTDGGMIGIMKSSGSLSLGVGQDSSGWSYLNGGSKYTGASASSYGASYTTNDVIGIAFDADNGTLAFYKNGASQGTAFTGLTSGPYFPAISDNGGSGTTGSVFVANFGQRPFAYTAPSGFKALCTANLPAPLVTKPNTVMDVLTWTGTGGSRTFSGLNFSPDLIWGKARSQAYNHQIYDIIRDTGASKVLMSNSTAAEGGANAALYGYVSGFNSNGFATTAGTTDNSYWNELNTTYVAWTWDAGTTTDTNNTAGSISSQVRANATAGFSIVTYTGTGANATVGHGLGVAPAMMIVKRRSTTDDWAVYHSAIGATKFLYLNLTSAQDTSSTRWQDTTPSSTVFSIGSSGQVNGSGSTYVAYCFAPVVGYSSFGSYTGNGSSDGPFVYTGFRPRWVMVKASTSVSFGSWRIYDSARGSYNVIQQELYANLSNSEDASNTIVDFLSNGFKLRSGAIDGYNGSGATIIYAAFAESPFNYARAR